MDFFLSQESLTAVEWILRAVVGFFFLLIVTKILGQRAISQLRPLDFAIALVIGNIIAHPLSDEHLALKGSIITTIVLVVLYVGGVYLILKWPWFRKLLSQPPITLVQNGKILNEGLMKARISLDVLLEELREDKIEDVKKVAMAVWEADGKISVFLDPKYEPLTPSALHIETEPFDFPRTIIKEGKMDLRALSHVQKDAFWVESKLEKQYGTSIKNVLLATIDRKENLKVFLYQ
jgi:uncharacterized membrane protein YcaP (DUF421 family)